MSRARLAVLICAAALGPWACAPATQPPLEQPAPAPVEAAAGPTLALRLQAPDSFGEAYAAAFETALASAGFRVVPDGGRCLAEQHISATQDGAPEKKRFSPSFGLESLAIKSIIRAGKYLYHLDEVSETVEASLRVRCGGAEKGYSRRYTYDKVSQAEINDAIARDQAELASQALEAMGMRLGQEQRP